MEEATKESVHPLRRLPAIVAVLALVGYVTAWVLSERGDGYYQDYVAAFSACADSEQAAEVDCNAVASVRQPLEKHKDTYATGDVFLNGAAFLTTLLILHYTVKWLRRRIHNTDTAPGEGTASDSP